MKNNVYTKQEIEDLSYTDFVGLVNQWNVPPGAFSTLNKWRVFGQIDEGSAIIEVASTTGFSSRELALMCGCQAHGIDISAKSIEAAKENAKLYAPNAKLSYDCQDATKYIPEHKYTHMIIGAAIRFFDEPQKALLKMAKNMLQENGYILSCEFYVKKTIPQQLVNEAREVFDITVTQQGYKDVMRHYQGLTLLYEERNDIELETEQELAHYCHSTIERFSKNSPQYTKELLDVMYNRLYKIKDMSNRLRPYQKYSVLVHKMDKRIFPNRYTELF